ncbi:MAG TPA: hypothetical protein VGH73_07815 [Thermoanaerobaculia bacterium]|jgi:hypothetical protein
MPGSDSGIGGTVEAHREAGGPQPARLAGVFLVPVLVFLSESPDPERARRQVERVVSLAAELRR